MKRYGRKSGPKAKKAKNSDAVLVGNRIFFFLYIYRRIENWLKRTSTVLAKNRYARFRYVRKVVIKKYYFLSYV